MGAISVPHAQFRPACAIPSVKIVSDNYKETKEAGKLGDREFRRACQCHLGSSVSASSGKRHPDHFLERTTRVCAIASTFSCPTPAGKSERLLERPTDLSYENL